MLQTDNARQITIAEMSPHVHHFNAGENKVNKISGWLIAWIKKSLKSKSIKPFDLLPSKGDLAFHIGVSKGTMQNVFRYVEDYGLVESKQKIGTYIAPNTKINKSSKLTSKRELATEAIKHHIIDYNYKRGDCLISTRKLSKITGISNTTIRLAVIGLISQNIIRKQNNLFVINKTDFTLRHVKVQTLVEKTADKLEEYIYKNYKIGEKLPANNELASLFNVSIKTIHDAIKIHTKNGILYTRRGQYGTIVTDKKAENGLYCYEKIELKIRHYIANNCQIRDKLPSIVDFAKKFNVSAKTIKKALDNLAEEGYVTFTRGRYGGTFVTDIPQNVQEAYKWLALSSDYIQNDEN